jgi:hypothetical protein
LPHIPEPLPSNPVVLYPPVVHPSHTLTRTVLPGTFV